MRNIIFYKYSFLQNFLFWSKKYIRNKRTKNYDHKTVIVQDDILGASEYRLADYEASLIESEIFNKLINESSTGCLSEWGGKEYGRKLIGKRIMHETKNIYISVFYAQAVIEKYKIKGIVYLWPNYFELKIFNYLKKINKIPSNIKILNISYAYLYLKSKVKFLVYLIKSLFFIEKIFLSEKKNKNIIKNNYMYAAYMDDGLKGWDFDKLLISDDSLNLSDVLFINTNNSRQDWISEYKDAGYNVCDIKDMSSLIDKDLGKITYYKKYFKIKIDILVLIIKYPWISSTLFSHLKKRFFWDIFYSQIHIKNIMSTMIADDITSSYAHKKNNTKTIFLYYSTTTNILKNIKEPEVSHCHDYTYMDYDIVISSKVSNEWFSTLQNNIKEYINLGPISSDLIIKASNNKDDLLKKIGIIDYKKIISFVDSPTGLYSITNHSSYKIFLEALLKLADINIQNYYLLKTKHSYNHIRSHTNKNIVHLLDTLRMKKNIVYANDFNLTSYDTIGLSDLTISGPESSVVYEALFAGKKTICFDPYLQYENFPSIENHIPRCKGSSYDEIKILHDYWLNDVNNNDFEEYLKSHVNIYFGKDCGKGGNIDQLKTLLKSNCVL